MPSKRVQFLPLTSIRFFLALWVVVFHQTTPEGYLGASMAGLTNALYCVLRTGYVAVGVFFVLSGFVLACNYSLADTWQPARLIQFARARFVRIYPAYFIGLLLVAPFVSYPAARVGKQMATAVLNISLLQSWVPRIATSWNSPGWSLSNEAFFYCCFPFIGVALWRLSRMRSLVAAALLIWAAALIVPLAAVKVPIAGFGDVPATSLLADADPFWAGLVKFNPLFHLPDFCIGIVTGRIYHELSNRGSALMGRGYWFYLPGIALEILVLSFSNSLPYPLVHDGLLLPLHALVILGFALGGGVFARILSVRPLIFLGNASYAMYIVHYPLGLWMDMLARRFFSSTISGPGGVVLYVTVVICISSVTFRYIEEPANRLLKNKAVPVPALSQPLSAAS